MIIEGLIKEVSNICLSYLSDEERIYIKKEWDKFDTHMICDIAAIHGWLDLLIWARKRNYEWSNLTCLCAAGNGNLEILKWLRLNGCEWDFYTCAYAAESGHLSTLEWARKNGCMCGGRYH